jgi:hypothetical protein
MVYFFLFSLPLLIPLVKETYLMLIKQKRFVKIWRWRYRVLVALIYLIGLTLFPWHLGPSAHSLDEDRYYPKKAVAFLQHERPEGNIFSVYSWGGYLIWKYPEKKVYIDGRMAIWQQDGYSALEEGQAILAGKKEFQPIFDKYEVTTVLLPVEKEPKAGWLDQILKRLLKKEEVSFSLNQELLDNGWLSIYQDEVAQVILQAENTKLSD